MVDAKRPNLAFMPWDCKRNTFYYRKTFEAEAEIQSLSKVEVFPTRKPSGFELSNYGSARGRPGAVLGTARRRSAKFAYFGTAYIDRSP